MPDATGSSFIKRHDEIKSRYTRRYDYRRAKCEDPKGILKWFNRVQITIMQHGIALEDIYNFDETSFVMDLVATNKVKLHWKYTPSPYVACTKLLPAGCRGVINFISPPSESHLNCVC